MPSTTPEDITEHYSSGPIATAVISDAPSIHARAALLALRLSGGDHSESALTTAAAATAVPQVVEAADTEPADVEDESAEQLATVGRPEYYGAVEPDADVASDVASDVSDDHETDRCYDNFTCKTDDGSSDVDTDVLSDCCTSGTSPLVSPLAEPDSRILHLSHMYLADTESTVVAVIDFSANLVSLQTANKTIQTCEPLEA
jgi:hypothetical protein